MPISNNLCAPKYAPVSDFASIFGPISRALHRARDSESIAAEARDRRTRPSARKRNVVRLEGLGAAANLAHRAICRYPCGAIGWSAVIGLLVAVCRPLSGIAEHVVETKPIWGAHGQLNGLLTVAIPKK
jgi:hypothetical protein